MIDVVPQRMGVRDQIPRLGKKARAPGPHRAHVTQHGDFLRRLVEPSPGAVFVWAMLAVGLMALPLDERAPSVGGDVAQDGGPAGVGFSHVEDLLTAVTPDCLLHLSALTRPRAQDEGSKGAPLRLFADLVDRRTYVTQNAQRQL